MPVYTLRAPDGRQVDIRADDEATAMRGAQEWYASQAPAKPKAPTAADVKGKKVADLSGFGPPTSKEYRAAVAKLPVGSFFRDYQGNVRRNDAGPRMLTDPKAGNPIVPVGGANDVGGGLLRGFGEGVQGILDGGSPLNALAALPGLEGLKPRENNAFNPMDVLQSASYAGRAVGRRVAGDTSGAARDVASARASNAGQRNVSQGGGYAPQTFAGRAGQSAGQLLPALAAPGSLPARIANVVAPLIVGEGAANIGAAMGADQGTQEGLRLGGQLVGGVGAGLRVGARPRVLTPEQQALLDAAPVPEGVAPKDYGRAVDYAARLARGANKTPEQIAAVEGRGVTAAEAIGKPGERGLAALARREGQTGDALEGLVSARQISRPDRILEDVSTAAGVDPVFAQGDMEALVRAGQERARPLYDQALNGVEAKTSPKLEGLLTRPLLRDAWKAAQRMAANDGEDPFALGLVDMEAPGAWERSASPMASDAPAPVPRGLTGGKVSQGPSLAKFIADGGGVKDATGELNAMDMEAFHKGKAFQRKLVGDADTLDGWAVKAWERGYFPGDQPPTPNEVLDALAAEARGAPRYARQADPMIGQRQAFRDAEAERVARGGGEPPPSPEDYMGGPMPFNEPVQAQIPSFKALDYVKKGVDRVINEKYRNPNTGKVDLRIPGAREEVALAKQFRDELVALNPSYKAALDTAGEYLQAETAFKFGQDAVFKTGVDARSFVKRLSDMTDGERQAVKAGVANRAYEAMLNGRLKPQMFNTPAVRMKLEAVFGRDGTQKFLSAMNSEAKMAAFERRYAPGAGSITADMAAAMAEQDGGNPLAMQAIDLAGQAVTQGSRAAVMNAVVNGAKGAAARWATRGMSVPVRDAAGNMLAGDPNQLAAILRAREAVPPQSPLNSLAVRYQIPGQSNPLNARAQRAPNPR